MENVILKGKSLQKAMGLEYPSMKGFLERWIMEESGEMVSAYFQMVNRNRGSENFVLELNDVVSLCLIYYHFLNADDRTSFDIRMRDKFNEREDNGVEYK
jgi:NTP pyrophosphatase (non-canonical NTP hydrolase)